MPHRTIQIEFINGPFDGHSQAFTDPPILKRIAVPVTENTLPLLEDKPLGPPSPITTVARYELRQAATGFEYHFVEAVAMKESDLEGIREAGRKAGEGAEGERK